jgi:hypothetical protein
MPATEKPRAEPEIIPPGDLDGRPMRDRYHFDVHGGSQRIYVTRLGPFGIVVLGLLIALIAAVIPIVLTALRSPRIRRSYSKQAPCLCHARTKTPVTPPPPKQTFDKPETALIAAIVAWMRRRPSERLQITSM